MSIDAGFLESLNQPLKKIVQDAANAIMDVYRKDEFESEIKSLSMLSKKLLQMYRQFQKKLIKKN